MANFRPANDLQDSVHSFVFTMMPTDGVATDSRTASAAMHDIFRVIRWHYGVNYYALTSADQIKIVERLKDVGSLAAQNLASTWDGYDFPAEHVCDRVRLIMVTLAELFPYSTVREAMPDRV